MKLEVLRISSQADSTSGILFDVTDGKRQFLCYTVEDEYRAEKVKHETRIPEGSYKLTLRSEGGFHSRYTAKYGSDWHKGMIYVNSVPGFEYILWHTGNTDESTSGCLILGDSQTSNLVQKDGFVGSSVNAYKKVYPIVRDAILSGEKVTVEYIDYDYIEGKKPSEPEKTVVWDFSDIPDFPGDIMVTSPLTKSDDVKKWQEQVGLSADGWFGNGSKSKVIQIQNENDWEPTGVLDLDVWKYSFAKKS
jgi:hypothetical protein|tara:strand:+ start:2728 stop:3471 length:744 start_codon:yes stop_codon:yes gene_type:complete